MGVDWGAVSGVDRPCTTEKQVFAAQLDRLSGLAASLGQAGWALLLLAPFVGSFLGVLIRRLPEGRPIVRGRSHCERCGARLTPRDLVPLISWLAARGRCRQCGHPLGWFYPGVELAALAVAAIALAVDGAEHAWLDCLLGWWLLALAWIYQRLRHREGLGQGDAKLFAAAGAWLGIAALPQVILPAALAALATAIGLSLAGTRMRAHSALPFGPFLALATWLLWLLGSFSR